MRTGSGHKNKTTHTLGIHIHAHTRQWLHPLLLHEGNLIPSPAGCPHSGLAAPSYTHTHKCESYASECTPQLRNEQARLLALREDNKGAEAALRKAKKRAQQDVEAVIGEYDQDLGSKEEEYQEVRGLGCQYQGVGLGSECQEGCQYEEVRGLLGSWDLQVPVDVGARWWSCLRCFLFLH